MTVINNKPLLRFPEFTSDWEENKISEIFERVVNPVDVDEKETYQELGIRSHGKGIFHKEPKLGAKIGNKRVFWVKENTFIVNIVFAWEQAVAKTTEKEVGLIASHRFPMYEPIENVLDLDFILSFFLRKKGKYILGLASPGGAGRNKTLGQKVFSETEVIIPKIQEQNKIARFLNLNNKRIDILVEKKEKLEAYKKDVMRKIFNQDIRFKDESGSNFLDWEEKKLGDIGRTYNGLTGKTKVDFGEGNRYIQYKQIFDNSKIDITNCGLVNISSDESQNKAQYGDIFFTISSETVNDIGMSSVLLEKNENVYLNSFCFGYRPDSLEVLVPEFSRYFFRNSIVRKQIIKLGQGSTRFNMSKVEFMKFSFFIPSSKEQIKIAHFLSKVDKTIENVTNQIKISKEFKKGLVQKMFV